MKQLGGPCLAAKQDEYAKFGPLGIGDCKVHYTNVAHIAATAAFQFFRGVSWVIVTVAAVTDKGPLASRNWRVTPSMEQVRLDPSAA